MTEDLTQKFKEIEEQPPKLLLKVSGKLLNLHGQYAERIQEISSVVYSTADIEETEKGEVPKSTKLLRKESKTVHTFPKNENGKIIAPLGGNRGYLKGALRAALTSKYGAGLARRGSPVFGLKSRLEQGVFIEPDFIELGETFSNPPERPSRYFLTKVGTYEYYDIVKKAPFEVVIRVESDIAEEIILELFSFIQRLGLGPKRRGLMRIEKVEKL
jgi:hypothetical protein